MQHAYPDSKVLGTNMGPTWVLLAPDGGPMNLAIRVVQPQQKITFWYRRNTLAWGWLCLVPLVCQCCWLIRCVGILVISSKPSGHKGTRYTLIKTQIKSTISCLSYISNLDVNGTSIQIRERFMCVFNRKCQDYPYMKWESWSTM